MMTEITIDDNLSKNLFKCTETPNSKLFIEYIVEKRKLQWELFKSIEQKAANLVLFSGLMIGFTLNLTDSYPVLSFNKVFIESFGISYLFLPLSLFVFSISILLSLKILSNGLFHGNLKKTSFANEYFEKKYLAYLEKPEVQLIDKSLFSSISKELIYEVLFLKRKNIENSSDLRTSYIIFSIGAIIMIFTVVNTFQ